jgi:hypothetical protein
LNRSSPPLDLRKVQVYPLTQRKNQTRLEDVLVEPAASPQTVSAGLSRAIDDIAAKIHAARQRGAAVMLIYGAHLLRNGAARILDALMAQGRLTHLATNGAGTIHDWEFSWMGQTSESVRDGVAHGYFGTWDETGRNIHIALLAAGVNGTGYGRALGQFIAEDGVELPEPAELENAIRKEPSNPLTAARADLLVAMREHALQPGRYTIAHRWKEASILAAAFRHSVSMSVHPGIGYDIIATHPMFHGAVLGRAAQCDFAQFSNAVEQLDGGVVLSIGSAIMGPQVFEKSLSCVNNLRLQAGRPIVSGHTICVVDLQDGGGWDWTTGEPPKTNPAYYLRFCKSYARMGGTMFYLQCDNVAMIHNLYHRLTGAR